MSKLIAGSVIKSASSMEKEKNDGDYTLVDLSPHETLVEFQEDSQANPNNWSFVSYYILFAKKTPILTDIE
jgi:hypothetical protein